MTGRPREFDEDEVLERILSAFWRDGYDNVTVAALVRETGVTAPSLYAAFGNKHAMFERASARYVARLDAGLTRDLAEGSTRQAVANVLSSAVEGFTAASLPAGCLVMAEPMLAARRGVTRRAIRARLQAGYDAGDLEGEPAAVGAFLDVVLAGMADRARDGADRGELDDAARMALAALFAPTSDARRPDAPAVAR